MSNYAIDLEILDGKTPVDQLTAWVDCPQGGSVLMRYATPDALAAHQKGKPARKADEPAQFTADDMAWWSAHAADWRGFVTAAGDAIPFSAERLGRLIMLDGRFGVWFIREATRWDNFRCPSVAAQAA